MRSSVRQAFAIAQVDSPFSVLIITAVVLHLLLFSPGEITAAFDQISKGFLLGRRARNLSTFRFENHFGRDLEALRAELGFSTKLRLVEFRAEALA